MKIIRIISLFAFVAPLCLSGCHGDRQKGQSNNQVNAIDLDKELSKEVSLFDFCDGVELIGLENSREAMMGEGSICSKAFGDSSMFFLSRSDNLIREFDYEGNLLRVANKYGRGPGEFTMSSDMLINRYTNTLDILDPQGFIYQYTLDDLAWKNTITIDFSNKTRVVHYSLALSSDKYLLCSAFESPQLFLFSTDSGLETVKIDNMLPSWILATSFSLGGNPFYETEEEVKYSNKFDGSIYTLDGSSMELQYSWDMGKHQIDISQIEPDKDFEYYRELAKTLTLKYAISFCRATESDRYIFQNFRYKDGNNSWDSIVLDKTDKSIRVFRKTKENVLFLGGYAKDNCMFYLVGPEYLYLVLRESFLNDEKSREVYKQLTDYSNMVLVKYHLKK